MKKLTIKKPIKERKPFTKTQWLCLLLYLISLSLPAIGFYRDMSESIEYFYGIHILIMGLLFGWGGLFALNFGVLAVYANLFFYYSLVNLNDDKLPIKSSVIMLFLASLSFFYQDFANGELHTLLHLNDYIYYWGYGAFFWFMAIIILAINCFYRSFKQKMLPLKISLSVLSLSFVVIAVFQFAQYHKAIDVEKKHFAKEIILTTYPIVGHKINKPNSNIIPITSDSVIEILNPKDEMEFEDFIIIKNERRFYFPEQFQYANHFWQVYRTDFDKNNDMITRNYIAKLSPARPVDFYYEGKRGDKYNHNFFIYNKNKKIIWQANNIILKPRHEHSYTTFYDYENDLKALFSPLEIPKNIPVSNTLSKQEFVKDGYGCHFQNYEKINDLNGVFYLDDTLYFRDDVDTEDYNVWCTPDYAIIATKAHRADNKIDYMYLFDRKKKEPIYEFESNIFYKQKMIDIKYENLMIEDVKIEVSDVPSIVASTKLGDLYFDVKR